MFSEEKFQRKWLTPDEEIKLLIDKQKSGSLSDREKERIHELKCREQETEKIRKLAGSQETAQQEDEKDSEDIDPHMRNPGQEGYL